MTEAIELELINGDVISDTALSDDELDSIVGGLMSNVREIDHGDGTRSGSFRLRRADGSISQVYTTKREPLAAYKKRMAKAYELFKSQGSSIIKA
ncbi:hypothetical protein F6R98_07040 [Candidatus Methylospira mobilis]|uniref:Uncharacterized protein n=1 Tax=Candidatus Methylospira mobilis TaxID=1808979 RepID=A0A5Q0BF04_9GAMM|nr:hypothetical protein [Candidatus Methylospira mobilis]QFY42410.1 hypothetical protein F6R98_07040 [Candidatus Methylospira mobilis]